MIPKSFDVYGNIALLKFGRKEKNKDKIKIAKELLKRNKSITTVLEKSEKISGRLRRFKTKYLAGKNTRVVLYRENGCLFRFDIENTYFSPRLSNERNEIAKQVKKYEKVLVLFAGAAPFSIVIAKMARPKAVYSVELNRKASEYAKENMKLNKVDNLKIIQGDVKKVLPLMAKEGKKFDRVVMPRPQLKDTFLIPSLRVVKKNGIVNYYGFAKEEKSILNEIEKECKKAKRQIKIIRIKKAGNIAPYKYRWRIDFKVLN